MRRLTILTIATTLLLNWGLFAPSEAQAIWPFKRGIEYQVPVNTVQIADKSVRKKIVVESVTAQRTANDKVEVTVRFYNKSKRRVQLAVRSSFMDESNAFSEPQSGWTTVHLQPKTLGVYQEVSIGTTEVANFLVEVQGAVEKRRFKLFR